MSRYIDAEALLQRVFYGNTDSIILRSYAAEMVKASPTADVAPQSEVEYLKEHLEMWCAKYKKAREEIERLEAKNAELQLDLYYSICREDNATAECAKKIFEELEYLSMDGRIAMNGYYAELKEKYIKGGAE